MLHCVYRLQGESLYAALCICYKDSKRMEWGCIKDTDLSCGTLRDIQYIQYNGVEYVDG